MPPWLLALRAAEAEATALVGPDTYRAWYRYLAVVGGAVPHEHDHELPLGAASPAAPSALTGSHSRAAIRASRSRKAIVLSPRLLGLGRKPGDVVDPPMAQRARRKDLFQQQGCREDAALGDGASVLGEPWYADAGHGEVAYL